MASEPVYDSLGLLTNLYALPSSDFHDVQTGNNIHTVNGKQVGFSAGPGYDLCTGRGTPVANAVVAGLVGTGSLSGQVFSDVERQRHTR